MARAKSTSTSTNVTVSGGKETTATTAAVNGKQGENTASLSANEAVAAAQGDAKLTAKADQLKRAADADAKPAATKRYRVLPGQFVRSGGVRFTAGEAVDLSEDQARDLEGSVIAPWGDASEDDDTVTGDGTGTALPPVIATDGTRVPNPDTAEGAELQKQQEADAEAADAAKVAQGLPSGPENK